MKFGNKASVAVLAVLVALPVAAQNEGAERGSQVSAEAIEVQMRQAEERLAEAAARVAELSSRRLPLAVGFHRTMRDSDRPMLGVAIGTGNEEGPVEGVTIRGVTPGSAAAEANLRAGDVLTAVNDQSLGAGSASEANEKLLDFMAGVEPGDTLDVEYLRDGEVATVEIEPRPAPEFVRAFRGGNWHMPPVPPGPGERFFGFFVNGGSWGDMEMVPLTEELGRYFGTDSGLLVVRAPADDSLKLRDGDVIQSIDGREPASVAHAMRILGSYQGGETLDIEIMRDKERQTVSIEMPDRRQGNVSFGFPAPAVAPTMEELPTVIMRTPADRI